MDGPRPVKNEPLRTQSGASVNESTLDTTVQSLLQENGELTKKVEELSLQLSAKESLLTQSKVDVTNAISQYAGLTERSHELTRQLEESKALLLSKDQTLQQLQGQLAESSRAIEELKQKNKSMEKEVHEVTSRLREAERQLEGKARLESELSAQLEELQSEKEIWTLKSNGSESELTEKLSSLQTELSSANSHSHELQKKFSLVQDALHLKEALLNTQEARHEEILKQQELRYKQVEEAHQKELIEMKAIHVGALLVKEHCIAELEARVQVLETDVLRLTNESMLAKGGDVTAESPSGEGTDLKQPLANGEVAVAGDRGEGYKPSTKTGSPVSGAWLALITSSAILLTVGISVGRVGRLVPRGRK